MVGKDEQFRSPLQIKPQVAKAAITPSRAYLHIMCLSIYNPTFLCYHVPYPLTTSSGQVCPEGPAYYATLPLEYPRWLHSLLPGLMYL